MKNINDLMQLTAEMMQTTNKKDKFFVEFYGHVQKIEVRYYKNGWSDKADNKPVVKSTYIDQADHSEQIEELYWWFKLLLKSNDYE
jgi:hypothetical protein